MKKYFSEFLGTLVLVLFGCGSAALAGDSLGTLGIAFAFGLSVIAMAYSIGEISGCHINPAISFGMYINKRMTGKEFIFYVISQFLGAIAGAGLLAAIIKMADFNSVRAVGLGANGFLEASQVGVSMLGALLFEIAITAVFVFVALVVTKDANNKHAGIVIGLTLVLVHILGIPVTGTSVNPARSFGPAILLGYKALEQVWVFLIGPMVGAAIAGLTYKYLFTEKKTEEEKEEEFSKKINEKEQKHTKKINEKVSKAETAKKTPKKTTTRKTKTKKEVTQ